MKKNTGEKKIYPKIIHKKRIINCRRRSLPLWENIDAYIHFCFNYGLMIFIFDCALSVGFKKNHCEYSFIRNKKWTVLQSSPFTRFTDDIFGLSANMFSGEDVVGLTDRWAMPNINKLVDDVGYSTVFNTWDYTCLSDWWWRIIMKQQIMWFIESKTVTFCARVTYPAMIGQQRARSVQMAT